jgi:hypothetical protein
MEPTDTAARRRRSTAASDIGAQLILWVRDGHPDRLADMHAALEAAADLDSLEPFGLTPAESETDRMTTTTDPAPSRVLQIVGGALLALVALFVITKDTGLVHGTAGQNFLDQVEESRP